MYLSLKLRKFNPFNVNYFVGVYWPKTGSSKLTLWRLGGFGDFRKKNQQFSVALPTP